MKCCLTSFSRASNNAAFRMSASSLLKICAAIKGSDLSAYSVTDLYRPDDSNDAV